MILADDFDPTDLQDFDASQEAQHLDHNRLRNTKSGPSLPFSTSDCWSKTDVSVLPMMDIQYPSEVDASHVNIPMYHHNLMEVVKSAFVDPSAAEFNWKGFTQH